MDPQEQFCQTQRALTEGGVGRVTSVFIAVRNSAIAVAAVGGPLRPRQARRSIGSGR